MGEELDNDFYDDIYRKGGSDGLYFREAKDISFYYPTWEFAYEYIKLNKIKNIVDFGCGPGHFASLFKESDDISYLGYDFSTVAIDQAIERNKDNVNNEFSVKNLKDIKLSGHNEFYTSFEFLEHISFDLELISKLSKGDELLFSVPNYDSRGHVIYFRDFDDIVDRYGDMLDLTLIHEVIFNDKGDKIYLCHGFKL